MSQTDEAPNPVHVECMKCHHIWIGLYLPQALSTAAKIMGNLCCPKCGTGAKDITIAPPAPAHDGELEQQQAFRRGGRTNGDFPG